MRFLVAVDLSPFARDAARCAAEFAASCDATIELIHVIAPDDDFVVRESELGERLSDYQDYFRQQILEPAGRICKEHDVAYDETLIHGHPVATLVEHAGRSDADLIVIGHRGRSSGRARRRRIMIGSVAAGVADQAPCPVMIVPSTAS